MIPAFRWASAAVLGGAAVLLLAPDPGPLLGILGFLALAGWGLEAWGRGLPGAGPRAGFLAFVLLLGLGLAADLLYVMAFPREIWVLWLEDAARGLGRGALGAGTGVLVALLLLLLASATRGGAVRYLLGVGLLASVLGLFLVPGPATVGATAGFLVAWSAWEALGRTSFRRRAGPALRWLLLWSGLLLLALVPTVLAPPQLDSWRSFNPLPDYRSLFTRWAPGLELPSPWPGSGSTSGARSLGEPPHRTKDPLFEVRGAPYEDVYLVQSVYRNYTGTSWIPRDPPPLPDRLPALSPGESGDLTVRVRMDYLLTGPFPEGYSWGLRRSARSLSEGWNPAVRLPWVLVPAARRGEVFSFFRGAGEPSAPDPEDRKVSALLDPVLEPWTAPVRGLADPAKLRALERALARTCSYTLTPPDRPGDRDFVADFLARGRRGFCEHFASAAVLLARSAGIPARYVTGWRGRADARGALVLDGFSAHAWAEVWAPDTGWTVWDPTPGVALSSAPPYAVSEAAGGLPGPGVMAAGPPEARPAGDNLVPAVLVLGFLGAGGLGVWICRPRGTAGFRRWLGRWSRISGFPGPEEGGWGAWAERLESADPGLRGRGRRWARLWERRLWAGAPWSARDEAFDRAMRVRTVRVLRRGKPDRSASGRRRGWPRAGG